MIKRALQTCFPLYARHLFPSPTLHKSSHTSNFRLFASSTRSQLTSLYSTLPSPKIPNSASDASNSAQCQMENPSDEVEDVSNEEFKKLIEKYDTGDENVLPSIFEAILKRKLSQKHEESDEELMDELGIKSRKDYSDVEIDDDFEELHSTDEESDG